jgi:hypothetical protein
MFPLTRPLRQGLATLALFAVAVVPTGWIAAMAWRINQPGHVRDVEIELRRQLGLQVTLQDVTYLRPGEVVYRDIVLRQEEPHRGQLAEIVRADAARLDRGGREWTLQLNEPQLRGESPAHALGQIGTLLQHSGQIPFERISLTAPSGRIDLGGDDLRFELREIAGEFVADPAMPAIRLAYRLAAGNAGQASATGMGTRCELTVVRDRRTEPVTTSVVLRTVEGLPLPVRALHVFFNAEEWLGRHATFEGTLSLHHAESKDWEVEFQGGLHEIDLGWLVGRRFPRHRLAGRARAVITSARWGARERPNQSPGWIEVQGELMAGQGSIGVDLLGALAREMKFRLSPRMAQLAPAKTEVEFRALGLSFTMHANGEIHLGGALGVEFPPDVVLAGTMYPLARAPQGAASVHGLIKTLFPVSAGDPSVLVPLTSETSVLLSLPVPSDPAPTARRIVGGN